MVFCVELKKKAVLRKAPVILSEAKDLFIVWAPLNLDIDSVLNTKQISLI